MASTSAAPTLICLRAAERSATQACLASTTAEPASSQPSDGSRQATARPTPPIDVAALLGRLSQSRDYARMLEQRQKLPAYEHRETLMAMLNERQVGLVLGAPGWGKSTQVPQLILADAAARGVPCRLLVAQPRRLAATALAERVSAEMCDGVGGACGYVIRGETKRGANTAVTFVTTGVLLRMLEEGPRALDGVTHVVLDEVHERTVELDLCLLALRGMLGGKAPPQGKAPPGKAPPPGSGSALRLVLMSATLDPVPLIAYFGGGAGLVDIPGRTFPVHESFLEPAVEQVGYRCDPSSPWAREVALPEEAGQGQAEAAAAEAAELAAAAESATNQLAATTLAERAARRANAAAASHTPGAVGEAATAWLRGLGGRGAEQIGGATWVGRSLRAMALGVVNEELVALLLQQHHASAEGGGGGGDGAALVFLPGAREIADMQARLQHGCAGLHVLPLHAQLSAAEQRLAFQRPPRGTTKARPIATHTRPAPAEPEPLELEPRAPSLEPRAPSLEPRAPSPEPRALVRTHQGDPRDRHRRGLCHHPGRHARHRRWPAQARLPRPNPRPNPRPAPLAMTLAVTLTLALALILTSTLTLALCSW